MPKVVVSETIDNEAIELLESSGFTVELARSTDPAILAEDLQGAEALVLRSSELPASVFDSAKELKIVSRHGTGINNIDVEAATKAGVAVARVIGANSYSVAEYHLTALLTLSRRIFASDRSFRKGDLDRPGASLVGLADSLGLNGSEVRGKTLAILGYGAIGRILSKLARAVGVNVIAFDPFVKEADVEMVTDRERLWKEADIFSICMPLTSETRDFIAAGELEKMKNSAIIINAGRGGIVNERDLAQALETGEVAGAAIDVFEEEPPKNNNPLLTAPNAVLTAHIAGTTFEAKKALSLGAAQNIIDFFAGVDVPSIVNAEVVG